MFYNISAKSKKSLNKGVLKMGNSEYSKSFPEHFFKESETRAFLLDMDENTYFHTIFNPERYYALPQKVFYVDEIIGLAKQVAQLLDMDLEIVVRETHLYMELNFDEMPIMGDLKLQFLTLLGLVDEFSFFRADHSSHFFRITLLYYTQVHINKSNKSI